VTLTGGTRGGWIRALLYNESDVEIDRETGPTGTGNSNNGGSTHGEVRRSFQITVVQSTAIPDQGAPFIASTWGHIKALFD
jgi:hypothetical protein